MEEDDRASGQTATSNPEERLKLNGLRLKMEDSGDPASPSSGSKMNSRAPSMSSDDSNAKSAGDSASTPDHGPAAHKPSKKSAQKSARSTPPLFDHLPDVTTEACSTFQVINDCMYGSRGMGSSDHDALDCDCTEEWRDDSNHACGEDSDCINRATKIECVDGSNCGEACQNQRFQRKQYADVSVIKTDKKGFGLRANRDLQPNDFIFEYIGEVINEPTFRNRMMKYDREGIKHFYFMSLTKSEFVDATKKGNLGRFCNHSCNPNCYVDKWVVGPKLRMGIFAGRHVRAGEELVFNYNVDRYGADPQPCYCGEANCVGFIGGKTQTERATKLPLATIEALGIDDGDSWDTAVAKKPRKKKIAENDEEFVNSIKPRSLDEDGVNKVMATLMQCKEKWIAVKLLSRLQATEDEQLRHRVVKMHGYQILKTTLNTFKEDTNIVLQILGILYNLPRITKNKISDSNIEAVVRPLTESSHEGVAFEAKRLLEEWSKLETAYRIPRKKHDPTAPMIANSFEERRNANHEDQSSKQIKIPANVVIPTGPRSNIPQRNANFFNGQRPRKLPTNLPEGWFVTTDKTGRYYFYDVNGKTQWQRPTTPAVDKPKASAKAQQGQKAVQDIIDSLTKDLTPRNSATQTPQRSMTPTADPKKDKWKSLSIDKQMKIYENTLFPHVKYVVDKFYGKLPKEDLKKFAREVNKKLVASDYKNNRVEDPTFISPKQELKVKKYVKDYFERAVVKYKEQQGQLKKKDGESSNGLGSPSAGEPSSSSHLVDAAATPADTPMSDVDDTPSTEQSGVNKRKREDEVDDDLNRSPPDENLSESTPSIKRLKEHDDGPEERIPSPPPPPPPPTDGTTNSEELREQEEELMRENEEAQRLQDEVNATAAAAINGGMDIDSKPLEHREQREVMSH
ncbi:putative histone-lysine N-methyltransferase, H3 lysine-36 specific SET2 [Podospora fimiseda]|uniref:Histone-lysine N-methyltransferase, H3 lysine-36 specific n=1 Tax=Podospora fimiseda TaxID=252190 RepID=A0AAN7BZ18_9PEZI|nr:putative histone-lysine N-methyltransferase, H3 lysine-36 specific SET2 [Podospora fimiseda]